MRKQIAQFVWCILFAGLLANSVVLGDGKHFPEKAIKVAPAIPSQRAIIAYKDGIETLMIESTLNGPGKEFGWIIPLPNQPTKFEKTSPGLLKILSNQIQSRIIPETMDPFYSILGFAVGITGWFFQISIFKPKFPIHHLLFWVLLILAWTFLFSPSLGLMTPHFTNAGLGGGPSSISGVTLVDQQEVGDYQVSVLEAKTADALDQWLSENGLIGLSAQDRPIIEDYISKGWCFIAARLHRPADGFSRPDPISVSFPTEKAIYPMRLTSTVGSNIYLELFVISDRSAYCSPLPVEMTSPFKQEKLTSVSSVSESQSSDDLDKRPHFQGFFHSEIQHSQADQWLWDNCWVTRFAGTLNETQQNVDLEFSFGESEPHQKAYFSTQSAKSWAGTFALLTWTVGLFLLTLIRVKTPQNFLKQVTLSKIFVIIMILSGICYGVLLSYFSTIAVQTSKAVNLVSNDQFEISPILEGMSFQKTDTFESMRERFGEFLRLSLLQDPITGDWKKLEESPGNYEIVKQSDGIILYKFDFSGSATGLGIFVKLYEGLVSIDDLLRKLSLLGQSNGQDPDILQYSSTQSKRQDSFLPRICLMAYLYRNQPHEYISIIIQDLDRWTKSEKDTVESRRIDAIQFELGMLGCITHIQPPREFTNIEAIGAYIKKVREMTGQSGS
jgi:hypothetical protein